MEHMLKILGKIGSSDSDIVCLPELWYTKTVTNFETEFDKIIDVAKDKHDHNSRSFVERRNNNNNNCNNALQISSPVIANDGVISGRQLKLHPFGQQRKVVKAGTKVELFESANFRFGIGICYDIVFPEVTRALLKNGADILFFPSKIRNEGIKPWHMYVQVRALENRIPIAPPNVCDDRNSNGIYRGKSIFVDFNYDYKTDIAVPKLRVGSVVNDQILIVDVDLNSSRKLRKKRFSI